jgi:hypothetical protein
VEPFRRALQHHHVIRIMSVSIAVFKMPILEYNSNSNRNEDKNDVVVVRGNRIGSTSLLGLFSYLESSPPELWLVKLMCNMSRLTVDDNFYSNAAHFCAALRKNTRICNLYCQAWFPADVLGQYLATAPRLSTIILELYHYEDTKSCESLLNGLVLNKTMRKVDLIHGSQQHSIWLDWLHHLLNHVTMEWFSVLRTTRRCMAASASSWSDSSVPITRQSITLHINPFFRFLGERRYHAQTVASKER